MDFVDLRRPRPTRLPPVLRTGAPSKTFATTLPPLFGEGRRLTETRGPRRVKLLLEPSRTALPAVPVALGAREILAQLRVLVLQFFDTAVPRVRLPPGCIRVIALRGARIPRVSARKHRTCGPIRGSLGVTR